MCKHPALTCILHEWMKAAPWRASWWTLPMMGRPGTHGAQDLPECPEEINWGSTKVQDSTASRIAAQAAASHILIQNH